MPESYGSEVSSSTFTFTTSEEEFRDRWVAESTFSDRARLHTEGFYIREPGDLIPNPNVPEGAYSMGAVTPVTPRVEPSRQTFRDRTLSLDGYAAAITAMTTESNVVIGVALGRNAPLEHSITLAPDQAIEYANQIIDKAQRALEGKSPRSIPQTPPTQWERMSWDDA